MTKAALLVAVALAPCAAYVVPASRPALEEGVRAGLVTEVPFEVRFSIGNLITVSGALLLLYCLLSYLLNNGEATLGQTLGFVYALPALLGGLALKYAELPPVPLDTSAAAEALRESKGTKTQNKILSDATRFTYGDAHMEEPLKALKLAPSGMGPPTLTAMREAVTTDGNHEMGMTFFSPNTPYRVWKDRAPRFSRFFGPNVRAELRNVDSKKRLVELALITCAEGADDEPLEVMPDGSRTAILTAAAEEEAEAAAKKAEAAAKAAAVAAPAEAAPAAEAEAAPQK